MRLITLVTIFLALFGARAWANKTALVVGNSTYQHMQQLGAPSRDAEQIALTLGALGFDVYLATNLNGGEQISALESYIQKSQGAELSFVYLAGHSQQRDGVQVFYGVDARPDVPKFSDGLLVDQMIKTLSKQKLPQVLVLDLYANPAFQTDGSDVKSAAQILPPDNTITILSEVSANNLNSITPARSLLAGALLDYLVTPNRSLSEVAKGMTRELGQQLGADGRFSMWNQLSKDIMLRPIAGRIDHRGQRVLLDAPAQITTETTGFAHKPILLDIAYPRMMARP